MKEAFSDQQLSGNCNIGMILDERNLVVAAQRLSDVLFGDFIFFYQDVFDRSLVLAGIGYRLVQFLLGDIVF